MPYSYYYYVIIARYAIILIFHAVLFRYAAMRFMPATCLLPTRFAIAALHAYAACLMLLLSAAIILYAAARVDDVFFRHAALIRA